MELKLINIYYTSFRNFFHSIGIEWITNINPNINFHFGSFMNNNANNGGSIYISNSTLSLLESLDITKTNTNKVVIENNNASVYGGFIHASHSNIIIRNQYNIKNNINYQ